MNIKNILNFIKIIIPKTTNSKIKFIINLLGIIIVLLSFLKMTNLLTISWFYILLPIYVPIFIIGFIGLIMILYLIYNV